MSKKTADKRTAEMNSVEKVRGVNDVLFREYKVRQEIEEKLERHLELYGYNPIEVPIVEKTDLYLRKAGIDTLSKLYEFNHNHRQLSLRPEITSSILRAYVNNLQEIPLPLRVQYKGPVFRYERPQNARYRQFTQLGIELIGSSNVLADSEIIAVACKGLEMIGISNYQVLIGHTAVLESLFKGLPLENYLVDFLMSNIDILKKGGVQALTSRLHEVYPTTVEEEIIFSDEQNRIYNSFAELFQNSTDVDAKDFILSLFQVLNIRVDSSRSLTDIADRLVMKLKRKHQLPNLYKAITFIAQVVELIGTPPEMLQRASVLLNTHNIDDAPLKEIDMLFNALLD